MIANASTQLPLPPPPPPPPIVNTPSPFKHNGNNNSFLQLAKKTGKLKGVKNNGQNLNLDQRLAQMFGGASTSGFCDAINSSPKTQTPLTNSSTSSQEYLDNSPKTLIKVFSSFKNGQHEISPSKVPFKKKINDRNYSHYSENDRNYYIEKSPNRKRKSDFRNYLHCREISPEYAKKKVNLSQQLPPPPLPPQISLRDQSSDIKNNDIKHPVITTESSEQLSVY